MTQTLKNFLTGAKNKEFATKTGTQIHAQLQHVIIDDINGNSGAPELIENIVKHPDIKLFFAPGAKTEVPIAGYINNRLVSRRIDRLLINPISKTIDFIDYKTDTDKTIFVEQYNRQLKEYATLLKSAYPDYKITGYILWLNDWTLDRKI